MKRKVIKMLMRVLDNSTSYNMSDSDIEYLRQYLQNATSSLDYNTSEDFDVCFDNCNGFLRDMSVEYSKNFHVYMSFTICIFGSVANIFNIIVLTRKEMACAPINRILTGLAVADMLIMLEYIPFAYYYYVELPGKLNFPYWGALYMLIHTHFSQILHTISICLTLTLAIWRYLAIGYPEQSHLVCSETRCTLGISLSYLLPLVLCFPTYLTFKIQSTTVTEDKDYILYHLGLSEIAKENNYLVLNFWLYAVVIKLLPCCILTILSCWLIRTLFIAKKRKQVLKGYAACPFPDGNQVCKKSKAERRADRTTRMLVAILLLFLLTEFPQGIFALVIGMKGKCIFLKCYQDFGEVMDVLALLNGSINFILFCWMNRMFRTTFGQLFRNKIMMKLTPANNSDVFTTYV